MLPLWFLFSFFFFFIRFLGLLSLSCFFSIFLLHLPSPLPYLILLPLVILDIYFSSIGYSCCWLLEIVKTPFDLLVTNFQTFRIIPNQMLQVCFTLHNSIRNVYITNQTNLNNSKTKWDCGKTGWSKLNVHFISSNSSPNFKF